MTFADQIRAARLKLGFTQAELAARLTVTVQTVSNWECGRVTPWPRKQVEILRTARERIIERCNDVFSIEHDDA